MATGYAIFIPNVRAGSNNVLNDVGLPELLEGESPMWAYIEKGTPHGNHGCLATWARDTQDMSHYVWHDGRARPDGEGAGEFQLGIPGDFSPKAIKKKSGFLSTVIQVGNRHWDIPIAEQLPKLNQLSPTTGRYERVVQDRYKWFWEQAGEYSAEIFTVLEMRDLESSAGSTDPVSGKLQLGNTAEYVHRILTLNYRLSSRIIDDLIQLDDKTLLAIVFASIEFTQGVEIREKKNAGNQSLSIHVS